MLLLEAHRVIFCDMNKRFLYLGEMHGSIQHMNIDNVVETDKN